MDVPDPRFRMDLHVHSGHSRDARGTVLELAHAARAAGLNGFALTDHDTTAGHAEIAAAAQRTGLLIVPAIETTTSEGHLVALGVRHAVPKGLPMAETAALVEEAGGVAVAAHPLRFFTGTGPRLLRRLADEGILHTAEARNARERRLAQHNTERLCREIGLSMTGGSDAHWVRDIGNAWTRFQEPLATVDDVLDAIRRGQTTAEGRVTPRLQIHMHRAWCGAQAVRRRMSALRT